MWSWAAEAIETRGGHMAQPSDLCRGCLRGLVGTCTQQVSQLG
jgi:hypothetical protein